MGMDPGPAGTEPAALTAARRVARERELRARHRASCERFEGAFAAFEDAHARGESLYEIMCHFHECKEARDEGAEAFAALRAEFGI